MPTSPRPRARAPRRLARVLALVAVSLAGLLLAAGPAMATEADAAGAEESQWQGAILAAIAGLAVGTLVSLSAEVGAGPAGHGDEAGHGGH